QRGAWGGGGSAVPGWRGGGAQGAAWGGAGSAEPQQRRLFWTLHYPRCQAADRRHDEDHGDPDRKHFVQQHRFASQLAVGTKPLAYFLKFHFQRENAKPDRHSPPHGRKLKPNGSLFPRTLTSLALCRVPDAPEKLWGG